MPSPATLAEQGLKALSAQDYTTAISLYTSALSLTPTSPDYYLKRSTAYQRSSQYAPALADAEAAVFLAHKRGKRELVGAAQLRRGIVFFLMGRYGDAGMCFKEAEERVGEKEKNMLGIWKLKLEGQLAECGEDEFCREVTVRVIPDVDVSMKVGEVVAKEEKRKDTAAAVVKQEGVVTTPPSKIRHEWYQTPTQVVFTLYVKGVPKDKAVVEITSSSIAISFPLPTGSDFTFNLDPLFGPINAAESSYSVLSTKVELKLIKSTTGKWAELESLEPAATTTTTTTTSTSPSDNSKPAPTPAASKKPSYPTSSKTGPKDWDKLAKDLTSRPKKKKEGGGGGKDDGEEELEDDSDYDGGDPVNHFFKKLYKDADDDTRRAMMKSYTESNGTALSTNWGEVGKGPMETSPPDGMVAKKWGE